MASTIEDEEPALKRYSLAEQVASRILEMIVERELSQGMLLPSTAELSAKFKVSRTVIREAIADLAGRGIVERSQGKESVVSTPGSAQLEELLRFRIRERSIEPREIMEFRQSIEVQASRLAAQNRTGADLDQLEEAWGRLAAAKTEAEFHDADIDFHRAVARASANTLIVLVHESLVELLRNLRRQTYRGRKKRGINLDGVVADHRGILDAVIAGNPDAAAAAMTAHLDATLSDLRAAP